MLESQQNGFRLSTVVKQKTIDSVLYVFCVPTSPAANDRKTTSHGLLDDPAMGLAPCFAGAVEKAVETLQEKVSLLCTFRKQFYRSCRMSLAVETFPSHDPYLGTALT